MSDVDRMGDMDIRDNWTESSDVLRTVDVTVISNEECNASEGTIGGWFTTHEWQITDDILHVRTTRLDSYQGDSGGPFMIKGEIPTATLTCRGGRRLVGHQVHDA
jgi:secreted trypsin-like serine protease